MHCIIQKYIITSLQFKLENLITYLSCTNQTQAANLSQEQASLIKFTKQWRAAWPCARIFLFVFVFLIIVHKIILISLQQPNESDCLQKWGVFNIRFCKVSLRPEGQRGQGEAGCSLQKCYKKHYPLCSQEAQLLLQQGQDEAVQ